MAARPARLALLVGAELEGVHWLRTFENALAAQSRFWGGRGNLPIPLTADLTDNEVFWALADVFDADAFVTYAPTWQDMKEIEPKLFDKEVTSWREAMAGRSSPEAADQFVANSLGEAAYEPEVPDDQADLIDRRLAPLSHPGFDGGPLQWFDGSNPAGWPFMEISALETLPEALATPVLPGSGAARRLLLTALWGRATPSLMSSLGARGIEWVEEPVSKYEIYERMRGRNLPELPNPWDLTMVGLGTFHSSRLFGLPAAVVVGDSPWDFALFYALLRLTGRAWWLPSWLRRDRAYRMSLELSIRFDPRHEGRQAVVVSTSSSKQRDEAAQSILELQGETLDTADWRDILPDNPMRVLAGDTSGRARLVPLVDDRVLELETPLMSVARTQLPAEMRWLSEARSAEWAPVRHGILGDHLLSGDSDFVRTSRDGVAYFSTASLILSGASLESVVVRPSLRPLSLVDQVQILLARQGWSCEISDKAIYARESMKLFGGFDALCDAILDPGIRRILDGYRARDGLAPLLSSDSRRYLMYLHFEQLLETDDARPTVEPLLDRGVLQRGVVYKCARCRQVAWHSAAAPPNEFNCERCGLHQDADRDAWFGKAEPALSYRLAEVVFQLFEHNGELPLLAAREAFGESMRPPGRGYELRVMPPSGKPHEVDIFQSDGYRLWIGEASTTPEFEPERLGFLAELAAALDAYGVLLATSKPRWSEATEKLAEERFPGSWPRMKLLSGVRTIPDSK